MAQAVQLVLVSNTRDTWRDCVQQCPPKPAPRKEIEDATSNWDDIGLRRLFILIILRAQQERDIAT
jgi:hypothetical protein